MKRFGRIIAAAMLCLVLACGLEAVALADGGAPAITLGAGALVKDSKVWFGTKNTSPILWRVLHVGKHDDLPVCRADGALLISNNTMEIIQFNLDIKNGWKGSNAQKKCGEYFSDWLTGSEEGAVLATSASEENNQSYGSNRYKYYYQSIGRFMHFGAAPLIDERFFFLSAKEANKLFANDDDRKTTDEVTWWLRSPYVDIVNSLDRLSGVIKYGGFFNCNVTDGNGARPAFNLILSSVIFSSSIPSTTNEYKLTLKDENLIIGLKQGASAARSGARVTVPYAVSGDSKTDATKVYAMVTDKAYTASDAKLLQYAALVTGSDGTGSFDLDTTNVTGTWGVDYHVYILAVNEGGEKKTDYASAPLEIHAHDWRYTAQGASMTAVCQSDGCDIASGLTLTISAPAADKLAYDGTAKAATLNTDYNTDIFSVGADDIAYYKAKADGSADGGKLAAAPVDAGKYRAEITAGAGENAGTAWVAYEIAGKAMTVSAGNVTAPYDGQAHGIAVTVADPASGAAVKYGTAEGKYELDASPTITDAGTLAVYFKVTAANYADFIGVATVTVTKVDPTATAPVAKEELAYTGAAQALIEAGSATGGTMAYAVTTENAAPAAESYAETIPAKN